MSIWNGVIQFGLASVPVRMESCFAENNIALNLLHRKCHKKTNVVYACAECNEYLLRDELVHGYLQGREYILVEDEELELLRVSGNKNLSVEQFFPAEQLSIQYVSKTYYLLPDKGGEQAYSILYHALNGGQKYAGLLHFSLRNRNYVGAIVPSDHCLLLHVLRYKGEVKPQPSFLLPCSKAAVQQAHNLISSMRGNFVPKELPENVYHSELIKLINSKTKPKKKKAAAPDVMVKLRQQLKKGTKKNGKRGTV